MEERGKGRAGEINRLVFIILHLLRVEKFCKIGVKSQYF